MIWFYFTFLLSSFTLLTSGKENDLIGVKTYLSNAFENFISESLLKQMIQENTIPNYNKNENATLDNDIMTKFFEKIKQDLPSMIEVPNFKSDGDTDLDIKLYIAVSFAKLINFTNYNVDNVNITMDANIPVSLETMFTFPSWSIIGNYELDISSPDIHIFGDGPFSIIINNMTIYTKSEFSVTSQNNLNMTNFFINITIDQAKVNFENLLGGDYMGDIINDMISIAIPKVVVEYQEEILDMSKEILIPIANLFFSFFSVPDLIVFINNFITGLQ